MKNENYCHMQNECKLLKTVTNQYNEVVKQNKSLQKENTDIQKLFDDTIQAFINIIFGTNHKKKTKD